MRAEWRTKELIGMAQGGLGFVDEQTQTMKAKLATFALRKKRLPAELMRAVNRMLGQNHCLHSRLCPKNLTVAWISLLRSRSGLINALTEKVAHSTLFAPRPSKQGSFAPS